MAHIERLGEFVGPGELKTAAYLEKQLPDDWWVICNRELVGQNSTRELDFVVVGNHAIFAVEEKHWWGPIHGTESAWVLSNGESRGSPLRQAEALAKRLASLVRDGVPVLKEQVKGSFVFGRVLLSHPDATMFVNDPRVATHVLRFADADEDLIRFDRQQAAVASIAPSRDKVVALLRGLPDRPAVPREIGSYEIVEVLSEAGPVRAFRGRHKDGTERTLKIIPSPKSLDPERYRVEQAAMMREYETLQKLAGTGRAPLVDPYFSWGDNAYTVLPVHPVGGRSIRADWTDAVPRVERLLPIVRDAFRALEQIHSLGVLHRAITPDHVHVRADACIFSDFLIARIQSEVTIVEFIGELDEGGAYVAPECRSDMHSATPKSDVYSLGAVLLSWIVGQDFAEPDIRRTVDETLEQRGDLPDELRASLSALFRRCLSDSVEERPDAAGVLAETESMRTTSSKTQDTTARGREGEHLDDQHVIVRRLGEGATAVTYLVRDVVADALFVVKVIKNPELAMRLAKDEFNVLRDMSHPNLPRVYDVRGPQHNFHLKLEYVPASTVRELLPSLRRNIEQVLRIGRDALAALQYIHDRGRLHRDVSPNNILVPDGETAPIRLIDFGIATVEVETSTAVGTPLYRAPEIDAGGKWTPRADLYSLGVVLFQALTGRLPFATVDGELDKLALIRPTEEETAQSGSELLSALVRSMAADPSQRFQSAADFAEALHTSTVAQRTMPGIEHVNPVVGHLRGLYRNSRIGNAGNRGLDDDFARDTYVQTRLDAELLPLVVRGGERLIVLTGNPGDGKTAFLQTLRSALLPLAQSVERDDGSGWTLATPNGRFSALYDASESFDGAKSDERLHTLLRPFAGEAPNAGRYTAALAVNDGRLLEFLDTYGRSRYPWLSERLQPQILDGAESVDGVILVDLKRRALIDPSNVSGSIYAKVLAKLTSPKYWDECERCVAQLDCPIRINAVTFADPIIGPTVRDRLHSLLVAVHLRRERRPTMRDLRSALAYVISRDLGCEDVHEERRSGRSALAAPERLYFSAVFQGSEGDPLLGEWAGLDPAAVPHPRLDRQLYFHRDPQMIGRIADLFLHAEGRPALPFYVGGVQDPEWIALSKRRYFFEGVGRTDERDLPLPEDLLPYRFLTRFLGTLGGAGDPRPVVAMMLAGLSRLDGVSPDLLGDQLALTTGAGGDAQLTVVKRFGVDSFGLEIPKLRTTYAEEYIDRLVLRHQQSSAQLVVSLDLFELLMRAASGYLAGAEEQQPFVEDLATFKNQLLNAPAAEIVLMEPSGRAHEVSVQENVLVKRELMHWV